MKVKDIDALRAQISHDSREAFTKHQVWLLASEHNKTTPTFDAIPKSVIEDIKAEIKQIRINGQVDEHTAFIRTGEQVKTMVLDIIDKHCCKANEEI